MSQKNWRWLGQGGAGKERIGDGQGRAGQAGAATESVNWWQQLRINWEVIMTVGGQGRGRRMKVPRQGLKGAGAVLIKY